MLLDVVLAKAILTFHNGLWIWMTASSNGNSHNAQDLSHLLAERCYFSSWMINHTFQYGSKDRI